MQPAQKTNDSQGNGLDLGPSTKDCNTLVIGGGPAALAFLTAAVGGNVDGQKTSPGWIPSGGICHLEGEPSLAFGKLTEDYDHYLTVSGTELRPRSAQLEWYKQEIKSNKNQKPLDQIPGAMATKIEKEGSKFIVTYSENGEEKHCFADRLVIATGHSRKKPEATRNIPHLQGSEALCKELQKLLNVARENHADQPLDDKKLKAEVFLDFIGKLPKTSDGKTVIALVGDGASMDEVVKILYMERENALKMCPALAEAYLSENNFKIVIFSGRCRESVAKDLKNDWIRGLTKYQDAPNLDPVLQLANGAGGRVNSQDPRKKPVGNLSEPIEGITSANDVEKSPHNLALRLIHLQDLGILSVCGRFDWARVRKGQTKGLLTHPHSPLLPEETQDSQGTQSPSHTPGGAVIEISQIIDCASMPLGTHDKDKEGKFIRRADNHEILDDLRKMGCVDFTEDSKKGGTVGILESIDKRVKLIGAGFDRRLSLYTWMKESETIIKTFEDEDNPLQGVLIEGEATQIVQEEREKLKETAE